ncbi:FAD-dependent oxidoreductase [bacterium]|nr:FAD-dependent oxidoreductase [bacterium]
MKRRNFISTVAVSSGALLGAAQCSPQKDKQTAAAPEPAVKPDTLAAGLKLQTGASILEPARQIPVIAETDVLVAGGGPAGVAAAIAAGRAGAKVILVERYNHLGGLWTGGLVLPLLSTHGLDKKGGFKQVIFGIGGEINSRLRELGMSIEEVNPTIDPEAGKYVLDAMTREAGVRVLYHCWVSNVVLENGWIKAVILETKSGRVAVAPKLVVDGTGDGDVLSLAGESYENMKYHIGLVHRLGNIDKIDKSRPGFEAQEIGLPTPVEGVNWFNMHGDDDQDALDLNALAGLQQKYRIQIWENVQKIRSKPGYEKVFLLDTAAQLGVRMSRILDAEYRLTLEDTMTYKSFEDVIGVSGAWTSLMYKGKRVTMRERPWWQIPYRALLPKKTENLIAAGRCFCFEKALVEDTRIIGTCLVTGHGAGAAAAVAAQSGVSARAVDVKQVQALLRQQNANLG